MRMQAISADLLPSDLGDGAPWSNGGKSDLVISLPLREAREIFERDYLMAQINRFGGNISRTASFIGMERSALHRKLKSLGVGPTGREQTLQRLMMRARSTAGPRARRRAASPMSTGVIVPHARRAASMSRIAGCNSPMRSMKCGASPAAQSSTKKNISTASNARSRELGMAMPMARDPLKFVLREIARRNRVDERIDLSAGDARRRRGAITRSRTRRRSRP